MSTRPEQNCLARAEAGRRPPGPRPPWRRHGLLLAVAAAIVAAAVAVRVAASRNDFWLDEIWSYRIAMDAESPLAIATEVHHDNNHILNTLMIRWLGERENWTVYRVPAVVAGGLTVAFAGLIGSRRCRSEAVFAMLLTGGSYLLIHYSSEARGYAPAVLFGFAAFYFLELFLDGRRWACVPFWFAIALGFLSHLTFVHFYAAALAWSGYRWFRRGRERHRARLTWHGPAADAALAHAVPVLFAVALYLIDVRFIRIGGGPEYQLWDVVRSTAALAIGLPETGATATAGAIAALAVAVLGPVALHREAGSRWLFFLVVVVVSPALLLILRPPQFLFERYFLISAAFLLLLLAALLGRLARAGSAGAILAVAVVGAFLLGNGVLTSRLLREGRGHYLAAMRDIAGQTDGPILVAGDHDFSHRMVMAFYARDLGERAQSFLYVPLREFPAPDWIITQSLDPRAAPPPKPFPGYPDGLYTLAGRYGFARLSGCQWFVYRKATPGNAGP